MTNEHGRWVWPYLETSPYFIRHAVASFYVRNMRHVVEVGGGKTPVGPYLPERCCYQNIDLLGGQDINLISLKPFRKLAESGSLAVVALGVESYSDNLLKLSQLARVSVLECATQWICQSSFSKLVNQLPLPTHKIDLYIDDSDYGQREMWIWTEQKNEME